MPPESLAMLPLGFVFGLVHAMDADHVVAVSSLAAREPGARGAWKISLQWSLGHAAILLLAAAVSIQLGLVIPAAVSQHAEMLVGVTMVWLAAVLALRLRRERRARMSPAESAANPERSHSAPTLIGGLHGLAGSASLFALIPAVSQGRLDLALGYIGLFGLGVTAAMVLLGALLRVGVRQLIAHEATRTVASLRTTSAALCCVVGLGLIGQGL